MKYKMEELVPIVAWLSEKYTGNDSTSITYEKAQQLMGAVLYCIREATWNGEEKQVSIAHHISVQEIYEMGYKNVVKKVKNCMEIYHSVLTYFDDYGNRCLSDTFLKGMPEFFKWYDARFNPQDTILTLDYPVLEDMSKYQGVDAIYIYLKCIEKEQIYLKQFERSEVMEVLENYNPQYEEMIDNVLSCYLTPL